MGGITHPSHPGSWVILLMRRLLVEADFRLPTPHRLTRRRRWTGTWRDLRRTDPHSGHFDTVVIGGGQAGLSVGYHLAKRALPFVILYANERIGDSWRKR